jgi:two-component system sensor histidine kinase BaeS
VSVGLDRDRLGVLVHEVRSPVAALAAIAETAPEAETADSTRADLARLALAACRAIERLVLDVAVASVQLEPLDLGVVVDEAVASHVLQGSAVILERDDDLVVDGDPVRLRQALDNLVANALTYGGADVCVRATKADGIVRISISDAGPGIPPGEEARIFEPGVRLARVTPGSGIGLALTRAIVEAHGGTISVESPPGAGATFTIAVPERSSDQPDTRASSS